MSVRMSIMWACGGLALIAGLMLVPLKSRFASSSRRLAPERTCPVPSIGTSSNGGGKRQQVLFSTAVQHPATVRLMWVNANGSEKMYDTFKDGEPISVSTFTGHLWRAYGYTGDGSTGKRLLLEWRVSTSASKLEIDVEWCGSPSLSQREVLQDNIFTTHKVYESDEELAMFRELSESHCSSDAVFPEGVEWPGFHIMCIINLGGACSDGVCDSGQTLIGIRTISKRTQRLVAIANTLDSSFASEKGLSAVSLLRLQRSIRYGAAGHLPKAVGYDEWGYFSPSGKPLSAMHDLIQQTRERKGPSSGQVYIYEGGVFIRPGVRVGHSIPFHYEDGNTDSVVTTNLKTLSLRPLVFELDNFLTEEECDHIQDIATPYMKTASVVKMDKDKGRKTEEWRTGQTHFLARAHTKTIEAIEKRVESMTKIPSNYGEGLQVLRYGTTEKYDCHHDYFDPAQYRNSPSAMRMIDGGKKNRLATVFWYISNVTRGGNTSFPRAGGSREYSSKDCSSGLQVRPQRTKVVLFYSLFPNGKPDSWSLHGGCPVLEGIKWAANKWLWNRPK